MMLLWIAIFLFGVCVYFFPTYGAITRKDRYGRPNPRHDWKFLALVNLVFGWTIIGWIVCFFWSAMPNPPDKR
jgi:hypothetical protein